MWTATIGKSQRGHERVDGLGRFFSHLMRSISLKQLGSYARSIGAEVRGSWGQRGVGWSLDSSMVSKHLTALKQSAPRINWSFCPKTTINITLLNSLLQNDCHSYGCCCIL